VIESLRRGHRVGYVRTAPRSISLSSPHLSSRLSRTLRQWREEILAYFATGGVSNGGTEAINGVIEKTRRLAHGFRNFTNYRLRILLAADGHAPTDARPSQALNLPYWVGPLYGPRPRSTTPATSTSGNG